MVHLTTALDPASAVPLYEQLYRSLAAEMRAGTLTAGTRMPGKRRLAAELSISVNTVDTAYQMLAAEGYPPVYLAGFLKKNQARYYQTLGAAQLQERWPEWVGACILRC